MIKCLDAPFVPLLRPKSLSTTTSKDVHPVERRGKLGNVDLKPSHVRVRSLCHPFVSFAQPSSTKSKITCHEMKRVKFLEIQHRPVIQGQTGLRVGWFHLHRAVGFQRRYSSTVMFEQKQWTTRMLDSLVLQWSIIKPHRLTRLQRHRDEHLLMWPLTDLKWWE